MLINELSKLTGVTIHTIRFYEKMGLIKGKRDSKIKSNNYAQYDDEAIEKLELVRDAKSIGFTLNEIADLMDAWYSNRMSIVQKVAVLNDKLIVIEEKIAQLKEMKKLLAQFKKDVINEAC
jgi:MerR family transcriptional regulator, copper efflux regulator